MEIKHYFRDLWLHLTNHFYLTIQGLLKAHVLGSYPAQSDQGLGVGLGLGLGSGLGLGLG